VVSLWNVDDESTASFMRLFYAQLRCNKDRANALRDAQLLHRVTHDHPFFWAPFVLVGDPTELPTPL
jgi:CHAT domain-containing protein